MQKAPRTWYIVRKWDFMVKRQKVWFLISILIPQNDSSKSGIFSCFLLKVWPLQQISGLLKIYMICSKMMFKFIFIMFWVPKTLYYSIMYIWKHFETIYEISIFHAFFIHIYAQILYKMYINMCKKCIENWISINRFKMLLYVHD